MNLKLRVSQYKPLTRRQQEIYESGKPVSEFTDEEMREMYYHITSDDKTKPLLGASILNQMSRSGIYDFDALPDIEPTESMLIGTHVHACLETNGEHIDNIFTEAIYEKPVMNIDGYDTLTDHQKKMLDLVASGMSHVQAFWTVKNTTVTRAVTSLEECHGSTPEAKALQKEVEKEFKPIIDKLAYVAYEYSPLYIGWRNSIEEHRKKMPANYVDLDAEHNSLKKRYRTIDEVYKAIKSCWGNVPDSLKEYFYEYDNPKVQCIHEMPIIWKYREKFWIKSMLDFVKLYFDDKGVVTHVDLVDFKTHSKEGNGEFHLSYLHWEYYRQFALYAKALQLNYPMATMSVYVLPISTNNYAVGNLIKIDPTDLLAGEDGGVISPIENPCMNNTYKVFLDDKQYKFLTAYGFVAPTPSDNCSTYKLGFNQILDKLEHLYN